METKQRASSMTNALRLLNLFTMDEPEWTLNDLADELDIGLSAVYRMTSSLVHEGFLVKDPVTKSLRLGSLILPIGHSNISSSHLCVISPPILEKLVEDSGETAHLSILDGMNTIYLQKFECSNYIHLFTHIGKKNPAHCTGNGQILLSYLPEAQLEERLKVDLPRFTANTITDPIKLKERLKMVRAQGFAFNNEEMMKGVSAIAAPVKDPSGHVQFTVNIAGPTSRINSHTVHSLSKLVMDAADQLSKAYKVRG